MLPASAARSAALHDLLDDDLSNIAVIPNPVEAAKKLVAIWEEQDLPAQEIALALGSHSIPDQVLAACLAALERDHRRSTALVSALFQLDQEYWENGTFEAELFGSIMVKFWQLDKLLMEHRSLLLDGHPLFNAFPMDVYWRMRVRYYIKKNDWKRAYDDLRRAFSGFHRQQPSIDHHRPGHVTIGYWAGSKNFLATHIKLLYEAMHKAGVLPEPPHEHVEYQSDSVKREYVVETRRKGEVMRTTSARRAGFGHIEHYFARFRTAPRTWEVTPEGEMFLRLSEHFRKT